jgi:outer membrane immunogenic protein
MIRWRCLSSAFFSLPVFVFAAELVPAAYAADLPIYKGPPIIAAPLWTGFYLGGHAGYGWGSPTFLDNFPTPDLAVDAQPAIGGGLGGLQAGYNYQFNWLVVGAEGEFTWSGVKDSSFTCFTFGNQLCSAHPEWFSTVTGRIGAVIGPALLYAKGGAAWANDDYTDIATCSGSQPTHRGGITAACGDGFNGNDTSIGWTIGGGIEYAFARNWSVWAEYDFMQFGGHSVPFTDGGTGYFTEEIHQAVNQVTVGVNYRFDPDTPLLAYAPDQFLALATDGPEKPDKEEQPGNRVMAYTGADIAKFSADAWAGALIAPYKDLDTSGLRVEIQGEGSTYQYYGSGTLYKGISETGDFLAGYGFEGDNYSINVLAGAGAENDTLSAIDPDNRVVGTQFGAAGQVDAWINPTEKTLIYNEDDFSTAFLTYYSRTKLGYDVVGNQIFVGPEGAVLGNERFIQWRAGASITQIKFSKIQIDLSAGYEHDSVVGPGAYGTVELSTNF